MYEQNANIKKEMENIKKKKNQPNGKSGPEDYNTWIGEKKNQPRDSTADLIKQN